MKKVDPRTDPSNFNESQQLEIKSESKKWKLWNGYLINQKTLLITAGLTTLAFASIAAMNTYTYYQNGKIEKIDCRFNENVNGLLHNFSYYKSTAENGNRAIDQYCLAELFKSGNGTMQSLSEARNWYRKAAEQGLTLAKKSLCQPSMFELRFTYGEIYSDFRSMCCPQSSSYNPDDQCLWYKPI